MHNGRFRRLPSHRDNVCHASIVDKYPAPACGPPREIFGKARPAVLKCMLRVVKRGVLSQCWFHVNSFST
jgi:hypothetical protein